MVGASFHLAADAQHKLDRQYSDINADALLCSVQSVSQPVSQSGLATFGISRRRVKSSRRLTVSVGCVALVLGGIY